MVRPIPYKGDDTYIFISYAHRDSDRVWPIVDRMQKDGYRVWYDEGIDPGTEWDENIAAHVNGCSFFIAFLSENYLASDNCKDELNFARDQGKQRILVYLEDVELPQGMAMRLGRSQAIFHNRYGDQEKFFEKLYEAQGIEAFGPGTVSVKTGEPARVETVSQLQRKQKKGLPRWVIPVAAVLVAAVVAAVVLLGGKGSPSGSRNEAPTGEVLLDTEEYTLWLVGDVSDSRYFGFSVTVENKTDREIRLSMEESYLNGVLSDPGWYCYVEGNALAEENIQWSRESLAAKGLEEITVVECLVNTFYTDDYADLPSQSITLYPQGEEKAQYAQYVPGEEDLVLVDDENYLVAITGTSYASDKDFLLDVVVVNRSDRATGFAMEDGFLNGYAMDPVWVLYLAPGKTAYSQMLWDEWTCTGEEAVLQVETNLQAYDLENYDIWLEQPVVYYPEGEEKAVLTPWVQEADDITVLDNEVVRVVLTDVVEDDGDWYFTFYASNPSETPIYITLADVNKGGSDASGCYFPLLAQGDQCIKRVWLCDGEESSGDAPENLSLTLVVESKKYDMILSETITLELN